MRNVEAQASILFRQIFRLIFFLIDKHVLTCMLDEAVQLDLTLVSEIKFSYLNETFFFKPMRPVAGGGEPTHKDFSGTILQLFDL